MRALLVAFVLSLSFSASAEGTNPAWNAKMIEINAFLSELAPFIFNETAFEDPANKTKIETLTGQLASRAHSVDQTKMNRKGNVAAPDGDPALVFLSKEFDDSVTRAHSSFQNGHFDYSRDLLRSTVSYCIACHTRAPTSGAQPITGLNNFIKEASASDRIRFFAATRQFDLVSEAFTKAFAPNAGAKSEEIETAARVALSVEIRVRRDLDAALKIAKQVSAHPSAPKVLKDDSASWVKELELWMKEAAQDPQDPKAALAAARELVIRGQLLGSSASARGDVAYLKASALLHDVLKKKPSADLAADALYFIGICYESLRDLGFWALHESYYEACISTRSNTVRAERCFDRLKDSISFGYTGSRGTEIPVDVQRHLAQLKEKAKVKK